MIKREKSLKLNMVLNAIKGLMGIIFPLITFPYVSRILGVDNLGKYNFSNSIISYFILIAGLGISTYAVREGARLRDKQKAFQDFANEMFTINVISTIVAYFGLGVLLVVSAKVQEYKVLLLILSLLIIFKTIGIDWIYSIFEDYAYITVRSIVFQLISLILLFAMVKTENDVNIYALITVISSGGSGILNYLHAKKYCRVKLITKVNWKRHTRPILVLFATSVTVTIYTSSDVTILGLLCGDTSVGLYSVSTKVYSLVKTLLSSVLIVSIPRLSALLGSDDRGAFNEMAADIYKTLISLVLPALCGIIILRKEIILILADESYLASENSLALLSVALFFCLGAWFWGQCILVPFQKENTVFIVTVIGAIVNIVLNFVLIPFWKQDAAAFTTVLAEGIAFVWCSLKGGKVIKLRGIGTTYIKVLVGCASFFMISAVVQNYIVTVSLRVIATVVMSIVSYFVIEIVLRNEAIRSLLKVLDRKA